jgi:hypothetical protein
MELPCPEAAVIHTMRCGHLRQHLYVPVLFRASPWAKMAFDAPQKTHHFVIKTDGTKWREYLAFTDA